MDLVNEIMAYEQGDMDEEQVAEFFQKLINTGMAWSLQGTYGRTAKYMIDQGYCTAQNN